MNLCEQFNKELKSLSKTEYNILLYLAENINKLDKFTIQEVADFCNSSTSSINRLVSKLGTNYSNFKYILQSKKDSTVKDCTITNYQLEFIERLQKTNLNRLVNEINDATFIYIVAVGQSQYLAKYLSKHLIRLHKMSIVAHDTHIINNIVHTIQEKDVVIFISSSGNTESLLNAAKTFSNKRNYTCLFSNNPANKIQKYTNESFNFNTMSFQKDQDIIYAQSILLSFIDHLVFTLNKLY